MKEEEVLEEIWSALVYMTEKEKKKKVTRIAITITPLNPVTNSGSPRCLDPLLWRIEVMDEGIIERSPVNSQWEEKRIIR